MRFFKVMCYSHPVNISLQGEAIWIKHTPSSLWMTKSLGVFESQVCTRLQIFLSMNNEWGVVEGKHTGGGLMEAALITAITTGSLPHNCWLSGSRVMNRGREEGGPLESPGHHLRESLHTMLTRWPTTPSTLCSQQNLQIQLVATNAQSSGCQRERERERERYFDPLYEVLNTSKAWWWTYELGGAVSVVFIGSHVQRSLSLVALLVHVNTAALHQHLVGNQHHY